MLLFFAALAARVCATPSVSYDERSLLLNGERAFTLSGSVHYQRVIPADWPRVLQLAVEMGLNSIQTYVQWDQHEAVEGAVSFSGQNNLTAFVALAGSLGLRVHVRIGPYICGEHFNGGIPVWMRSKAACFRCADPGWEAFSKRVLELVVGQLTAAGQLWTQGGPVFMLQVENEYSGPDTKYLTDMVMAARAITTDVPWVLCHDLQLCSKINAAPGAPPGGFALCTINGFWMEQPSPFVDQPSPSWVALQRSANPGQFMGWTEDQGWFDQWGVGQRVRVSSDILYGIARSFSYGFCAWGRFFEAAAIAAPPSPPPPFPLTLAHTHTHTTHTTHPAAHHNFYMLTGGSNFGFSAADGVTTAYAPDTAIDWLLLRHEPKFSTFAAFHRTIAALAPALLAAPLPPAPTPLGKTSEVSSFGDVAFLSNRAYFANASEVVFFRGAQFFLPNHTVVILNGTAVVFNTSAAPDAAPARRPSPPQPPPRAAPPAWGVITETIGAGTRTATPATNSPPLEMLNLTNKYVHAARPKKRA